MVIRSNKVKDRQKEKERWGEGGREGEKPELSQGDAGITETHSKARALVRQGQRQTDRQTDSASERERERQRPEQ